MKTIKVIMLVLFVYSFVVAQKYNDRTNGVTSEISPNYWQVEGFANCEDTLKVEIKEKYGNVRTFYCRAIFTDGKKYKLVAPWLNVELNLDNITDKTVTVLKSK